MTYLGDINLGDTIDFKFATVSTAGVPTTLAGSPVVSAYPGNSTTQLTAGITLSVDFDSVTGMHNVRVVASSGNGYATATNYALVITTGTVGGSSVVGYVIGHFSIEARSALRPTVAARTLDVSATGEAGLDWANIGSPTTAVNLSATNIDVDQVVASVSGAVGSVTGAVGSVTGAVGSIAANGIAATSIATGAITAAKFAANAIDADALAADAVTEIQSGLATASALATVQADTDNIQTRLPAALVSGRMDASVGAMAADVLTAASLAADAVAEIADGVWDEDATGHQTQGTFGQAIGDPVADTDTIWGLVNTNLNATVSSRASQTSLDTLDDYVDTEIAAIITTLGTPAGASISADIAAIEAQTDDIGTAGAGLTNIPWNANWDAEVQSEVNDGLIAYGAATATNVADVPGDVWDITLASHITAGSTGAALNGATAPTVGQIADAVWDEAIAGHLGAGSTGEALNAAGAAGDPWTTTLPGAYGAGSAGNIIGNNLNATVSSRLATAGYTAPDNASITTILSDTNDIQTRLPAALVSGRMDSSVGAMASDVLTSAALAASAVTEIQSGLATSSALATVQADTDDIQARLPAALIGGRMDASVGAMAANTLTASALAADAVAEIQSGLSTLTPAQVNTEVDTALSDVGLTVAVTGRIDATISSRLASASYVAPDNATITAINAKTTNLPASPAAVGSAMTLTAGERISIADALLTRDWTAVSGIASRSVLNALRAIRNRVAVAAGVMTVYQEDDASSAWTAVVTTDASADPVTQVDPT